MRTVFSNVTKGVLANKKDLIQAFDTDDHETVCLEILKCLVQYGCLGVNSGQVWYIASLW